MVFAGLKKKQERAGKEKIIGQYNYVSSITRSNCLLEGGHIKISPADFVGVMHEVTA